jgi:hypothetical protein
MAQGAELALMLPKPAAEQTITVEGELVDPKAGPVPCVVIRMPWWRAQSLGEVLTRWNGAGKIMEAADCDEGELSAGEVGKAMRMNGGTTDGLELPKPRLDAPQTVTVEGEIWDSQDYVGCRASSCACPGGAPSSSPTSSTAGRA